MKSRATYLSILLAILCVTLTVAEAKTVTDPNSGLTITVPDSWMARSGEQPNEPDIAIANTADAFSQNPPEDICIGIFVAGKTAEIGMDDPIEVTKAFVQNISKSSKITKEGEVKTVTLNGQPAAYKMMAGEVNGRNAVYTIVAVVAGENLAVMVGTNMGKAEHDKTLGKIAGSMRFGDGGASSPAPVAAVSAADTDRLMDDFLTAFVGDSDEIEAAMKKHAASDLDDPDTIDAYNLGSPEILSKEDRDGMRCYSVRTKAGVSLRTWDICWQGGKIKTVKQTAMGFAGGGIGG